MLLTLCAACSKPLGPDDTRCRNCGEETASPVRLDLFELGALPRQRCPACGRSAPAFARTCPSCRERMDPGLPLLPAAHQLLLDARSFEDSVLLAAPAMLPEAREVGPRLERAGLVVHELREADRPLAATARWALEVRVGRPTEAPAEGWTTRGDGVVETRGTRLEIWAEVGASVDLPEALALDGPVVGVAGHCSGPSPARELALQLAALEAVVGEAEVWVDATAQRPLTAALRQRLREGAALPDLYDLRRAERAGVVWLRTVGLDRLGAPELEALLVPPRRVDEVEALLHRVAAHLVATDLPAPARPFTVAHNAEVAWLPWEEAEALIPTGVPGRSPADRAAHDGPTLVLFAWLEGRVQPLVEALGVRADRGLNQPPPPATRAVSPAVAAGLSLLWPGLGQIYLGQALKGVAVAVFGLLTCNLLGLLNLVMAADGWQVAGRLRRGEVVGPWRFF